MVIFTINCPAPPVIDLAPPQHLRSKFSGAAPAVTEWNAQDCGISKAAKDTSMLPSKIDQTKASHETGSEANVGFGRALMPSYLEMHPRRQHFSVFGCSQWEWALLARYVYTYKEFVIVTEAPQCNRMTATGQDTDNKIIIYKYTNRQCTK